MARRASRTTSQIQLASPRGHHLSRTSSADIAAHGRRGFTIVELLIVVVVIAILAAISIVSYNGISNRAKASSAQQGASQAAKKVLAYAVDNADSYPAASGANGAGALAALGISTTGSTSYQYTADNTANPSYFCITATTGDQSYWVSSTSTSPKSGGCPGHGQNGVAAIANLIPNPSVEVSTTTYGGANLSVSTSPDWASAGTKSLRQSPNSTSGNDSYSPVVGDAGAVRLGMEAGKTYTLSATIRMSAAQTGSLNTAARSLRAYTKGASPSGYQTWGSNQASNAAGSTRLSVTFTLPSDASEAFVRLYNGALQGGGDTYWDAISLTEGSTTYSYADGNSPSWIWNGTPNNSTSSGPPL